MSSVLVRKTIVATAIAAAMGTAPVLAVDLLPIEDNAGGYAWDGFYAGVLGGFWNGNSFYTLVGGTVGANFTVTDNFVLGVEGRGVIYSDGDMGFDGTARFGAAFQDVLVYADVGAGLRDGFSHTFVGGGAEIALANNMSLDGRVEFVTGAGFNAIRGTAALNFHF